MLGKREPDIYGHETYNDVVKKISDFCLDLEVDCEVFQSNHEGVLVDRIQEANEKFDGVIINPAALTHYSYAIMDAIKSISIPVIEVHISNIHAREEFRRHSVTAGAATGLIAGLGTDGYLLAVRALLAKIKA
tara:strand:+ start:181 stop:579 length:399 start_codon:yes stop_codon:yes gene_type:complete